MTKTIKIGYLTVEALLNSIKHGITAEVTRRNARPKVLRELRAIYTALGHDVATTLTLEIDDDDFREED